MRYLLLLALVACAEPLPELPTDSATTAKISAVRKRLMGPEGARFRNVRYVDDVLCGEVAAMNAAKEYTGWHKFSVNHDAARIAPPDVLSSECQ